MDDEENILERKLYQVIAEELSRVEEEFGIGAVGLAAFTLKQLVLRTKEERLILSDDPRAFSELALTLGTRYRDPCKGVTFEID